MNSTDLASYLSGKGKQTFKAAGTEITAHCWWCPGGDQKGKGRLYLNTESWLYDCKKCGQRGNRKALLAYFGDQDREDLAYLPGQNPAMRRRALSEAAEMSADMLLNNPQVLGYLTGRGLSLATIVAARLGFVPVSWSLGRELNIAGNQWADLRSAGVVNPEGQDFFSNHVTIPYFSHGDVVQLRGRALGTGPKYVTPGGDQARLFNADALHGAKRAMIVEGEFDCFSGDTQILTPHGWVRFDEYHGGPVAQWEPGGMSMVEPLARTEKDVDSLLRLSTKRRGGIDLLVTPGHRMVSTLGSHVKIHRADERPSDRYHVPRTGALDGPGLAYSDDEIALLLAISADSTIDTRKLDGAQYVRFGFTKHRKSDRLVAILDRLGVAFNHAAIQDGAVESICFRIPNYLVASKMLPTEWLTHASSKQREFILSEMVLWDGNHVLTRDQDEYSTRELANAEWMQTMAHTSGRVATIIRRSNEHGEWLKVSVLHAKTSTSWQAIRSEEVPGQRVFCVQVPSGMLLVRRNEMITVSGNCLMVAQTLRVSLDPVLRATAVVGVAGAQSLPSSFASYFEDCVKVYVGFDPDEAGTVGALRVKELLGSKARVLLLPTELPECDWSDYLTPKTDENPHGGHDWRDLQRMVFDADSVGRRLYTARDAYLQWQHIEDEVGGIALGFEELDAWMAPGLKPGQLLIPIARTATGKTQFLINVAYNVRKRPTLFISLEMTASEVYARLRRVALFWNPWATDDMITSELENLRIVDQKITEGGLSRLCEEFEDEVGMAPQLAMVDYLGYYANGVKGASPYERNSKAVIGLKEEAKACRVGLIVPHQAGRQAKDGTPVGITDARDSGVIEDTADMLLSLYRPSDGDKSENQIDGTVRSELLKNRNGRVNVTTSLNFSLSSLVMVQKHTKEGAIVDQENQMVFRGESYAAVRAYREINEGALRQLRLA